MKNLWTKKVFSAENPSATGPSRIRNDNTKNQLPTEALDEKNSDMDIPTIDEADLYVQNQARLLKSHEPLPSVTVSEIGERPTSPRDRRQR
jgi:hypothetical protein